MLLKNGYLYAAMKKIDIAEINTQELELLFDNCEQAGHWRQNNHFNK